MVTTTTSIVSLGQACVAIQAMPDEVRSAAEELGIVPACRINLVVYYDEDDVVRIGEKVWAAKAAMRATAKQKGTFKKLKS